MTLTEEQRELLVEGLAQDRMESFADNHQVFAALVDWGHGLRVLRCAAELDARGELTCRELQ